MEDEKNEIELYSVVSGGIKFLVQARSVKHAFREFFNKVNAGEINIDKLAIGVMCKKPNDSNYKVITTIPLLYKMGLIRKVEALMNMKRMEEDYTLRKLKILAERQYKSIYGE